MRFSTPALTLVTCIVGMPAAALAQANPSAQQLINQLRPSTHMDGTTRGIRMLPAGSAGSAHASSSSAHSHAEAHEADRPSASLVVDFLNGSAELTPQAAAALDQLGAALTSAQLGSYRFKIIGHTDTTGSAAVNQALSTQRADAVKEYLKAKFQIADDRLQAIGVGQNGLAVPTPPNTSERRNRRVEIINLST